MEKWILSQQLGLKFLVFFFWLGRNYSFTYRFKLLVFRVQTTRFENNTVRERQAGKVWGKGYNAALTQKRLTER